jgi:hypothetical protein
MEPPDEPGAEMTPCTIHDVTPNLIADWRRNSVDAGDFAMAALCDIAEGKSVTGRLAIRAAAEFGSIATLQKYADEVDGAREVSADEAEDICREDASLVYLDIHHDSYYARSEIARCETDARAARDPE